MQVLNDGIAAQVVNGGGAVAGDGTLGCAVVEGQRVAIAGQRTAEGGKRLVDGDVGGEFHDPAFEILVLFLMGIARKFELMRKCPWSFMASDDAVT